MTSNLIVLEGADASPWSVDTRALDLVDDFARSVEGDQTTWEDLSCNIVHSLSGIIDDL